MLRRLLCCLLLLLLAAAPLRAEEKRDCTLKILTSFNLDLDDFGRPRVPATLNGQPFRMLLDTGDYYSVVTGRTAKVLGIEPESADNFALVGWGGNVMYSFVTLDEFALGRLKRGKTQFMVMKYYDPDFDGLLGADFLYYFDLDFDFAKGKLNLISQDRCPGKAVYWSKGDYARIPFDWRERQIRLTVTLDGKEVDAMIDTGAADTVMSLETAARLFGLDEKKLKEEGGKHPFKQLSLGGVSVLNPAIDLVSDRHSRMLGSDSHIDMILGMTVLRRLHFYVGYKEEALYATPATQY